MRKKTATSSAPASTTATRSRRQGTATATSITRNNPVSPRGHTGDAAGGRLTGLPPVCGPDPRILILGSFPSVLSLEGRRYYGNPKNRFWAVMEKVLEVPAGLPYGEQIRCLTQAGVGLWDVVASCEREGSADSRIRDPVPNDIPGFFRKHPTLRLVALNGTAAANLYRRLAEVPGLPSVTLPSTSPAFAAMPFEEKVRKWQEIVGHRP